MGQAPVHVSRSRRPAPIVVGSMLLFLGTSAFAGCVGHPSGELQAVASPTASQVVHGPSHVDLGQGGAAIEGMVIDPELLPLADAHVQILGQGEPSAQWASTHHLELDGPTAVGIATDAEGKFGAKGLPPGPYLVYASKDGYQSPPPRKVDAAADQTVTLRFTLAPLPVAVPYHASVTFKSMSTALVVVFTPEGDAESTSSQSGRDLLGSGTFSSEIEYRVNDTETVPLETLVAQSRWTPSTTACRFGLRLELFSPEQDRATLYGPSAARYNQSYESDKNPFFWDNTPNFTNPVRMYTPRDGLAHTAMRSANRTELNHGSPIEIDGKWRLQAAAHAVPTLGTPAVDVSCAFYQTFENWLSAFYIDPAPAGWTVFADG